MRILFTLGILVGALALWGCPKRPEVVQAAPAALGPGAAAAPAPTPHVAEAPVTRPVPPPEPAVQPTPSPAAPAPAPTPAVPAAAPLKDVFFDFDKATIREDQKAALNTNVGWLKANGQRKLTIEGHCDERGTAEYNLGLGERRAKAVKDYLVAAGIPADRIATVSYGKERPFVMGHDESAWKWNRRAQFVITSR
jgi:peptidoglycan-associated lipoprotein